MILPIYPFTVSISTSVFNNAKLSITESYMGKAEFYSIDLTAFNNVTFYNSHLIDPLHDKCSLANLSQPMIPLIDPETTMPD